MATYFFVVDVTANYLPSYAIPHNETVPIY